LGKQRYIPAGSIIVRYLDFKLPEPPPKPGPVRIGPLQLIGANYPAAEALVKMGRPCSTFVAWAAVNPAASALIQKNALQVLWVIHSENIPEAVTALTRIGQSSKDPLTSQRAFDLAREVATKCPEPERNSCMNALNR
jgi:hypothetical protein